VTGLLYAAEEIPLTDTNIHTLDNCINRALYKIFWCVWQWKSAALREYLELPNLFNVIEHKRRTFMDGLLEDSRFLRATAYML